MYDFPLLNGLVGYMMAMRGVEEAVLVFVETAALFMF
jgi:hypothetical protein